VTAVTGLAPPYLGLPSFGSLLLCHQVGLHVGPRATETTGN